MYPYDEHGPVSFPTMLDGLMMMVDDYVPLPSFFVTCLLPSLFWHVGPKCWLRLYFYCGCCCVLHRMIIVPPVLLVNILFESWFWPRDGIYLTF